MALDIPRFLKATKPFHPLDVGDPNDRAYYVDLAAVRGDQMIEVLKRTITRISPDEPTCQLFTGHIGCGKSTELRRLKADLEKQQFHVAYFEGSQYLEIDDVDVGDILLAISGRISDSLEQQGINLKPPYLVQFAKEVGEILRMPIDLSGNLKFSLLMAEITTTMKSSPQTRPRLRDYVEPRTKLIIDAINRELLVPALERLKQQGKKGLVAIVDDLDRIENRPIANSGQSRPEYLFVNRSSDLRRLACHVVYTIPLVLTFSNYVETIRNRFGLRPQVLPMVPVKLRNGEECLEGLALLRQLVLARAFPEVHYGNRLDLVSEVFVEPDSLDRLCRISGGHVRNLLVLLFECLRQTDPPISKAVLEGVIQAYRQDLSAAITHDEWDLLKRVKQDKSLAGEQEYETALKSLFVFEYQYQGDRWFDVNPILLDTPQFRNV